SPPLLPHSTASPYTTLFRSPLRQYTPCRMSSAEEQAAALAIVHAELVLIHPFREGNGRCARLLAMLMGLQAGLPALDFGGIRGRSEEHTSELQSPDHLVCRL